MSILHNINYMKRFVHHPCATPNPLMLIEFAFEAALPVLFELLSADILDKAIPQGKQAWRKAAAGNNRSPTTAPGGVGPQSGHGRKAGGRFGRRTPGRKVGPREWLFDVVDAEQTGAYWWLVADLFTEFLARWSTLIYLKQGCPFDHECYRQGPFSTGYGAHPEAVCILPVLSTGVVASGGLAIQQLRKGKFSITYTGRLVRFLSDRPPSAARLELRGGVGGQHIYSTGAGGQEDPAGGVLAGGFYHFDHNGENLPQYQIVLVNEAEDEDVAVVDGLLMLSSGFCNNAAPTIAWDNNHLIPSPHARRPG